MSVHEQSRRLTAPDIRGRKGGEALVCLTSYHAHTARILDSYCDVILVGDSLGMVMHGLQSTVPVTLDMMILQGNAVMRGSKRALVMIDLPFSSYEASKEQAFTSAARVLKETGCGAIKLEGGRRMAETIAFLVERGVPVMGHVGLTPQAINTLGSFGSQGRDEDDWAPIEADARAVADAGAFSVVLEGMAEPLARRITAEVAIPTIGIGASVACDGQILVLEDMLGLSPRVPKFVKRFGDLGSSIELAVKRYAEDVRARHFPGPDQVYPMRNATDQIGKSSNAPFGGETGRVTHSRTMGGNNEAALNPARSTVRGRTCRSGTGARLENRPWQIPGDFRRLQRLPHAGILLRQAGYEQISGRFRSHIRNPRSWCLCRTQHHAR